MPNMFRLNVDGTVDKCDDTPDVTYLGPKYVRSTMRERMWVCVYYDDKGEHQRIYVDDDTVPNIIKMFDLLEP